MMCDDLVSVIIPVYNDEKHVKQCVDSYLKQTYENLEILLIDDGSTDNSPAICEQYSADDRRVRVFHRSNSGPGASRQFGIDNCLGEYFITVDSDDYVTEDFIEKLYRTIKDNDADVSVCGITCFSDATNKTGLVIIPSCREDKLTFTKELLASDFYRLSCDLVLTDTWNKLFRTQFVRNTNVRIELPKKYNGSELQFNHRLVLHCPVYSICRESLMMRRIRQGSRIQRKDKPFQEGFEVITESLIKECETVGMSLKEQLSNIYYGFMGMVVQDIDRFGGSIKNKHRKFRALVSENKRFLDSHRDQLEERRGFSKYIVSLYTPFVSLPAFTLSNALWLDAAVLYHHLLKKIKNACKKIKRKAGLGR